MVCVLDAPMRGGGLGEREGRIDQRLATALGEQRPDAGLQRVDDLRLLGDRARPERRAGVDEPLGHDRLQVDLDLAPAQKGDLDDAAVDRRGGVVARDIVAADHVEDDVGALAGGRRERRDDEVLVLVDDRQIGAEAHAGLRLFGRADGRQHARLERLGELDRRRADARRRRRGRAATRRACRPPRSKTLVHTVQ